MKRAIAFFKDRHFWLHLILSMAILLLIFWYIDFQEFFVLVANSKLEFVVAGILLYLLTLALMSYRIRMILDKLASKISFFDAFRSNIGGMLASDFTPGRSGYFTTAWILNKRFGVSSDKALIAIVSPQISEFFIKAFAAAGGILLALHSLGLSFEDGILLFFGVIVVFSFSVVLYLVCFSDFFIRHFSFLKKFPYFSLVFEILEKINKNSDSVKSIFPSIVAISLIGWLIKGAEWYVFGSAMGVNFTSDIPPWLIFLFLQPLITALQFIPFPTVAGLGLSEAGAAGGMVLFGASPAVSVSYALFVRGITTLIDCLGIGMLKPQNR